MNRVPVPGSLHPFQGLAPRVHESAFIAPGAQLIGDVEIGPGASVWFNCVLRGDLAPIRVGAGTNIQDGSIVHVDSGRGGRPAHPALIGAGCLIGHMAIVHGCTLEGGAFVGMGAIVMDGCVIEPGAMLAAGALLTPGKRIGAGELWTGRPARLARTLTLEERAGNAAGVEGYAELARLYRAEMG